jgi:hypothetical protein
MTLPEGNLTSPSRETMIGFPVLKGSGLMFLRVSRFRTQNSEYMEVLSSDRWASPLITSPMTIASLPLAGIAGLTEA